MNNTEPKPRFENDESVYLDFGHGDITGPYEIEGSHFNTMTRVFMYRFKGTTMGVGECHLKRNKTDKRLRISECIHDGNDNIGIFEGLSTKDGIMKMESRRNAANAPSLIFFRPDNVFIDWLVKYADNRLILEVGCGDGALLERLADKGARVFGVDPFCDPDAIMAMNENRIGSGKDIINVLNKKIEDADHLLRGMKGNALILIARPCHSNFVEYTIAHKNPETEVLYISLPENIEEYNDMGRFEEQAVLIEHKGFSPDGEKVWSVK